MANCLEGLTVLDLSRVLAGPYCTMVLADMGANVIKIEEPGKGDDARQYYPYINNVSAYFMSLNRNKKSITINLKTIEGKEIFKKLALRADVVVENFRPGTMEKLGLGYDTLKEINPGLVYAACSGFGATGPWSQKPSYDVIVQGTGGIMSITGQPGGEPTKAGASIGDITAGLFTAIGILEALYYRSQTGEGQKVDVSMLDCQVAILENAIARYAVNGVSPGPIGNRNASITPFEAFHTKSGYVIFAAGNDNLWGRFCSLVHRDELFLDPRFATNLLRTQNHSQLKPILDGIFLTKTSEEWIELLEKAGIPCGPINDIEAVIKHPQVLEREMIIENVHPVAGKIKMAGVPVKLSKTPGGVRKAAPVLGEQNAVVLGELGYSEKEIARLKEEGII